MDFELTISGLCIVAIKSSQRRPTAPSAVDIICPRAHHHRTRLNYDFTKFQRSEDPPIEPELVVDPTGARFASLDLCDAFLKFEFTTSPYDRFALQWGPDDLDIPPSERWMNWVPSLEDIGFENLKLGRRRPDGATARISLPKGELECRNVVRDADTKEFAIWEFPATKSKAKRAVRRALANEVIYRASSVGTLLISDAAGNSLLSATQPEGTTLKMGISNDIHRLTIDTPMETSVLEHLEHVDAVARPRRFIAPRLTGDGRTGGGPVCSQVITHYR